MIETKERTKPLYAINNRITECESKTMQKKVGKRERYIIFQTRSTTVHTHTLKRQYNEKNVKQKTNNNNISIDFSRQCTLRVLDVVSSLCVL